MNAFSSLWADDSGATMVEYALMLAFIAIVCIAAVQMLGTSVKESFESQELLNGLS